MQNLELLVFQQSAAQDHKTTKHGQHGKKWWQHYSTTLWENLMFEVLWKYVCAVVAEHSYYCPLLWSSSYSDFGLLQGM